MTIYKRCEGRFQLVVLALGSGLKKHWLSLLGFCTLRSLIIPLQLKPVESVRKFISSEGWNSRNSIGACLQNLIFPFHHVALHVKAAICRFVCAWPAGSCCLLTIFSARFFLLPFTPLPFPFLPLPIQLFSFSPFPFSPLPLLIDSSSFPTLPLQHFSFYLQSLQSDLRI